MHGIKRRELTQEFLSKKRARDAEKIVTYRTLTKRVLDAKNEENYTLENLNATTRLLELNPEFNAVWNFRRDTITHLKDELDVVFWDQEIRFTTQQLKLFPKVYWIWNHRVWCLNAYPGSPVEKWQQELLLVNKLLTMDARNFHSWHYRRVVIKRLEQMTRTSLNQQELDYTTAMINANISNFSAWHLRATLLPKMFALSEIPNVKDFIQKEQRYITNAMFTDAEDQSVWYYIKWFVKSDCVLKVLSTEEYKIMLQELKDGIVMINLDEMEFSGKENMWCLKLLCFLETIQVEELGLDIDAMKPEYLRKLVSFDPLRKNRYRSLAEKKMILSRRDAC
ncbi:LAME_0D07338g1_1 [Lachancea meyersii CBS 8951]|uniref:Geranylgeranyl transferase type-2 subunit alpha n=1 Tax=Lachancea meyersii CBS 8951 TaxID=1266667 RepID=A0A1G4J9N9_9SACH|nr:LAME_0D07338g1_1 [Lachancea meyersii CBS 8951]